MRRSHHRWHKAALLLSIVLSIAACGDDDDDDGASAAQPESSTSAGAAPTTAAGGSSSNGIDAEAIRQELAAYLEVPTDLPPLEPLDARPPEGETFYYITNGLSLEQEELTGVEQAAAALGWTVESLLVDDSNPATYNSAMLTAINSGATAVSVTAIPTAYYTEALEEAKKAGVIVVDLATGNEPQEGVVQVQPSRVTGPVWGKVYALGALADAVESGVPMRFVSVKASAFDSVGGPIVAGAKETIAKHCPTCPYDELDISVDELFSGQTPAAIVSYLQRNPDVNYLGFSFGGLEIGARAALDAAGFEDVKLFGVAPEAPQFEELRQGQSHGWAVVPFQMVGWMMVDAVARHLAEGEAGSAVHTDALAPTMLATPENDAPAEFPVDYDTQFKTLWKVTA
jgi:ribose transport system substrate-binding protein